VRGPGRDAQGHVVDDDALPEPLGDAVERDQPGTLREAVRTTAR
jgi:hypothetical protein